MFKSIYIGNLFFYILISFNLFAHQAVKDEFFAVDLKAALVVEELGGGVYNSEIDAFVPFSSTVIRSEWSKYKNEIAERIGSIDSNMTGESERWENSARTIDELLEDAKMAADSFRKSCLNIADKTHSIAYFGHNDQSLIKERASLTNKVKQTAEELGISREDAVTKIRDALRGTIIVDYPEQVVGVVEAINEFALSENRKAIFINTWEDNRPSGYVGVHAKILLPIRDEDGELIDRNIIVEIQIHLKCIVNASLDSAKERTHQVYEQMRGEKTSEKQYSASTLLYLTCLKECPKAPALKPKAYCSIYDQIFSLNLNQYHFK